MRLDAYLVQIGMFDSRTKAQQAIERREIILDGVVVTKSSYQVATEPLEIRRICVNSYVSIGGFKLEKALEDFDFDVSNLVVADIGASTGGFTHCLLLNKAKKVYSVDLRDDLLHESLKNDNRVKLIVKNAKFLTSDDFDEQLDLLVADLSFISLSAVVGTFKNLVDVGKYLILLIKPQFETGKRCNFKNGIIRDKNVHLSVLKKIYNMCVENDLAPIKITKTNAEKNKNVEFLILLRKGAIATLENDFYKDI